MNESWTDSIRFSLTAILAAFLFGIVILAPLTVRNVRFKQLCYQQQLELIALETNNKTRKLFSKRIETSPALMEQITQTDLPLNSKQASLWATEQIYRDWSRPAATEQEQEIALPEALVIHPDQMLLVSVESFSSVPTSQRSKSQFLALAEWVEASSTIQNRLLFATVLLLLFGSIPSTWFHRRTFQRQIKSTARRILARYRHHNSHDEIQSPHWDTPGKTSVPSERSVSQHNGPSS